MFLEYYLVFVNIPSSNRLVHRAFVDQLASIWPHLKKIIFELLSLISEILAIYFGFQVFAKFKHHGAKLFWNIVIAWIYYFIQPKQIYGYFNFIYEIFTRFKHHFIKSVFFSWVLNFLNQGIVIKAVLVKLICEFLVKWMILFSLTWGVYSLFKFFLVSFTILFVFWWERGNTLVWTIKRCILVGGIHTLGG